ncbi:MAG: type I-E CRISPR-associated protein Cas6/Cse3/CasE [Gammaproteobacteria bacterium]|jgi:CRISPR system Cascade subunit CasE|nr:type I-E CRISPR-associated protein Cas6/Cse3/CasE [Gammaproteobacteria bacterium]
MYFSLITPGVGVEREALMQAVKNAYSDHQLIWQFLKAAPGTERDFLFRRRDVSNSMPGFYVVSHRKPKPISEAWEVQSREYDPQLRDGQQFSFELRANPVTSYKVNNKSQRVDVVIHEKKKLLAERGLQRWLDWKDDDKPELYKLVHDTCSQWLIKRAERMGFQLGIDNLRIDNYAQHKEEQRGILFSTVDFSGALTVINHEQFTNALFSGIGRAKAFGCGLLLVKPSKT